MYYELWSFEFDPKLILNLTLQISDFVIFNLVIFDTQGATSIHLTLILKKFLILRYNLTNYEERFES